MGALNRGHAPHILIWRAHNRTIVEIEAEGMCPGTYPISDDVTALAIKRGTATTSSQRKAG